MATWVLLYNYLFSSVQFSSVQFLQLFETPWTAACQASLSITNSQSLLKLMPIKSVMPSNHLILCHPLLLLPSIFPSIRVFSNESVLRIRWPKYGSFSFSIGPFNEYSGLISFRMDIIWKSKKSDSWGKEKFLKVLKQKWIKDKKEKLGSFLTCWISFIYNKMGNFLKAEFSPNSTLVPFLSFSFLKSSGIHWHGKWQFLF